MFASPLFRHPPALAPAYIGNMRKSRRQTGPSTGAEAIVPPLFLEARKPDFAAFLPAPKEVAECPVQVTPIQFFYTVLLFASLA